MCVKKIECVCVCVTNLSLALVSAAGPCLVAFRLTEIFLMTGHEFAVAATSARLFYLLRAHTRVNSPLISIYVHNGL